MTKLLCSFLQKFRFEKKIKFLSVSSRLVVTITEENVVRLDGKKNKFRSEDCWLTRPLWRGRHVVF